MAQFHVRGILLDIEGTTSAVSYVYDVMFPFARRGLPQYLATHWGEPAVEEAVNNLTREAESRWPKGPLTAEQRQAAALADAMWLMDSDAKTTGLKQLQGLVWENGFHTGELTAHVYDDVRPALERWCAAGLDVRIYSSGSVHAQKLFFGHSVAGDLLPLVRAHYDTTTGPKKEAASYRAIAAAFQLPANQILFLSDIPAELDAAQAAGMQTGLCLRPGNAPVKAGHGHAELRSFDEIDIG